MDGFEYKNVHIEFASFSDKVVAVFTSPSDGKLVSLEAKSRESAYHLAKISIDCRMSISKLCSTPKESNQSRTYNLNFSVEDGKVVVDVSSKIILTAKAASFLSDYFLYGNPINDPHLLAFLNGLVAEKKSDQIGIAAGLLKAVNIIQESSECC